MKYLVLWEFAKKQDYIFKSNKLVEVIGGSLIMKNLTADYEKYNLSDDKFIISGGGKALYEFETLDDAKGFNQKFSFDALKEYDGLKLFMVMQEYDEKVQIVSDVIDNLYIQLENKKRAERNSMHQVSFGIERPCKATAMPASFKDKDGYISKEIYIKRKFARDNQDDSFKELIPNGYELERTIDNLTGNNDKNYIGIVHIDGNSMGEKFKSLKAKVVKKTNEDNVAFNKRYIKTLKKFSIAINEAYNEAFFFMTNSIEENKEKLLDITGLNKGFFPLRPIILAGDDVTYISSGFIAIESARVFIETLNSSKIVIEGINMGHLQACAGIALVKSGYPFIKGYEMAEQLCSNAKKELILKGGKKLDASAIDFHIAQGEFANSIDKIRENDYSLENEKSILNMRPLLLDGNHTWRNYQNFIESINNVNLAIKTSSIGRNKIKTLRGEIKKGRECAEHFFKFYNIEGGRYLRPLDGTFGDYTFNEKDGRCMYLDAIEVMDLFVKLDD